AEQEVQRRDGAVIKAERDLQKAAFYLSLYLWDVSGKPQPAPNAAMVPQSTAPPVRFADEREVEGQRLALERRPELKIISLSRDISQVDLALGRNQRLPAVDFSFSPGRDTGVGGIGTTLKAGLTISLPLRQRTAQGQIQAAQLKLQKLELDLQSQQQVILTEVSDALNAINTTYDRYRAAEREVQLARELEQGERTRFSLGDSTLFLVNQRERATAEAENKLIEIQAEYEQSVATFRAATGGFKL
ncbi:MAG TPA: TolC family protein, partial [Blastocatellia bacterium]|nr:TolC family protein [Blastocatellia bacterium]